MEWNLSLLLKTDRAGVSCGEPLGESLSEPSGEPSGKCQLYDEIL